MDKKLTIIPLLLLILVQSLNYVFACQSVSRLAWEFDWEGVSTKIYAPYQADPGDSITIRVEVEAKEDLANVSMNLHLYGSISEGYDTWYYFINLLNDQDLTCGAIQDQNLSICIPLNLSSGLTYGKVTFSWKVYRYPSWSDRSKEDSFTVTYVRNKQYEDLLANNTAVVAERDYWKEQSDYWENQSDYWRNEYENLYLNYTSILDDYDKLLSESNTTTNLMYIFIATTLIFLITTAYFASKQKIVFKRKRKDPFDDARALLADPV